jgi:hypothetical protein
VVDAALRALEARGQIENLGSGHGILLEALPD